MFIINILENIGKMLGIDVYPEFAPNKEIKYTILEVENMVHSKDGKHFTGSTADFFTMISEV